MIQQIKRHADGLFIFSMVILIVAFGIFLFYTFDKPSERVRHYECYSGGVLVVDQDYRLNNIGNLLDESGNRVSLDNLDCVITR